MATVGNLVVNLKAKTAEFGKGLKRARKSIRTFKKALDGASKRAAVWSRNLVMAGAAVAGAFVKLAMEQERAEMALDAALQSTGQNVAIHGKALRQMAADIQKVTVHGDEFVLGLMTAGMNLGITADKIGGVTKQAIGLATVLKMDLNTAMRYMVLAQQGEMTMLRRYLPALRATEDATEQLAIVTEAANRGWEQAQAETKTTRGGLLQLKNALGDVGETFGKAFLPMMQRAIGRLRAFAGWAQSLSKGQIRALIDDAKKLGLVLLGIWAAPKLVGAITTFIGLLKAAKGAMIAFKASTVLATGVTAGLAVGLGLIAAGYADIATRAAKARWGMFQITLESRETGKLLRELGRAQRELSGATNLNEREAALKRVIALRERLIELSDEEIRKGEEKKAAAETKTWLEVLATAGRSFKPGGSRKAIAEINAVKKAQLEEAETQIGTARRLKGAMQAGGKNQPKLGDLIKLLKEIEEIRSQEKKAAAKAAALKAAMDKAGKGGATADKQDKQLSLDRERNRLLKRGPVLG